MNQIPAQSDASFPAAVTIDRTHRDLAGIREAVTIGGSDSATYCFEIDKSQELLFEIFADSNVQVVIAESREGSHEMIFTSGEDIFHRIALRAPELASYLVTIWNNQAQAANCHVRGVTPMSIASTACSAVPRLTGGRRTVRLERGSGAAESSQSA